MSEVPLWRLYLLRAVYLLIAVAMGGQIWPLLFNHRPWEVMHSVAVAMLAALTALCLLGLRYPLKMLPLLFVEFAWKAIWLGLIYLPLWQAGTADAAYASTAFDCSVGIVFPLVIPWPYVWRTYVAAKGDRWA